MSYKTSSPAHLSREASNPLHSLFMTILIIGTVISFFGIASTSDAPSDGPLDNPKTSIRQGALASGVRESLR